MPHPHMQLNPPRLEENRLLTPLATHNYIHVLQTMQSAKESEGPEGTDYRNLMTAT